MTKPLDSVSSPVPDEDSPSVASAPHDRLGEILGLLAHDLRNPLAALASNVGYLGMLDETGSEDAVEALQDLQLSVEALGRIVNSVEVLSHDLREKPAGLPTSLPVASLIHGFEAEVQRAAESHGVTFRVELAGYEGLMLLTTEADFVRALGGLLHNALTVSKPREVVSLSVEVHGDEVHFIVTDTGPIVRAELAESIFSASGQVQIKTSAEGRYSRGLGLYVSARCARLAGLKLSFGQDGEKSQLRLVAQQAS